ncbi:hypothetical protein Clacol_007229 [Clathrus columnatus]|uniref:Fork-head domain-containing protein n=1 Tax=Clathrus columnatus TaxID=1419009 RepID=A0AAV5AGX7_9AGAM|nr:hypothetical protein Clacol_007229 [Clathrus columnatus]
MNSIPQNHFSAEDDIHILTPELLRPVTVDNQPVPNRSFYPLRHHQQEFDDMERRGFKPPYSLNMLTDAGDDSPPHNLSVILKCAILGSPRQKLTLREIRIAMCRRFAYYSTSNTGWCDEFERVPRPKTSDDTGDWWRLTRNTEPRAEDLTPIARSRRAPSTSSPNRARGLGFPNQSRQRRVEPWMEMTTTFTTSEDQDREDFYAQYVQGGHADAVNQYATGAQSPSTSVASTAQLNYRGPPGATALVDVSREALPGIHSLGLPGLGTRSGGQSYQAPYYSPQSPPDRGTYDEYEYHCRENDYEDE